MSERYLIIEGARQNNLKNINLSLPHNKVIAITGVSGSGKSSLAFDTIFAEGQWRFIESLSTYARLFLEKLDRPDVDAIHNIRPAIALEQKNPVRGSRSTVGTITEIYDLIRLLFSKIAKPFCPICGKEIRMWDPSQIVAQLLEKYNGGKAVILFQSNSSIEELKKKAFYRIWINGVIEDLSNGLYKSEQHGENSMFDIVLDRLIIRDDPRLSDSIETAWREGEEKIKIIIMHPEQRTPYTVLKFSSANICDYCQIELPRPHPLLFSFNHPVGVCPECKGFGNILTYDEDLVIPDKSLSLFEGAIDPWNKPSYRWWKQQLLKNADKEHLDIYKPFNKFNEEERTLLFKGTKSFYGINDFFEELESKRYKLHIRVFLSRYRRPVICSQCKGKKLKKESLAYKLSGFDIQELCSMPISELILFFGNLNISPFERDLAKEILRHINLKLSFLKRVGLDYLTLSRDTRTLSGGEYQRVNLSNQLASFLTGTLYVLDEPTVGLHARDTEIISKIMKELADLGNTVIVVEHDKKMIESSDWIVELGPGGGNMGGEVVFSGNKTEFMGADTLTSRYLKNIEKFQIFDVPKIYKNKFFVHKLTLFGAKGNNLKSVNLEIPLKTLVAVTGVSGSGKSSLIVETLYRALAREYRTDKELPLPYERIEGMQYIKGVRLIAQTSIGRTPRSNPVTYLKIFDQIRKVFAEQREAKAYGYSPGFFSFNVKGGRCEICKGAGYQKLEMYFFEDLYVKCEGCDGKRYKPEALRITFRGKSIDEVLNMTIDEAILFFDNINTIREKLALMKDIGLGYLKLGQSATTLSGGESQRLKICSEMITLPINKGHSVTMIKKKHMGEVEKGYLYILDEPTIGLHFKDIKALLDILRRLVQAGNTVLLIEHNLDLIGASDWIIDMGPEAGEKGGEIIFSGLPEDIVHCKRSYTGKYLKEHYLTHSPIKS